MVKRGWAAKREGFWATRLNVRASNDLQMERNLTGGLPVIYQGHTANTDPFLECFSLAHETKSERGRRGTARVSDRETDNGEEDRMHLLKNMQMKCR